MATPEIAHIGCDDEEKLPDVQEVKPVITLRSLGSHARSVLPGYRFHANIQHSVCVALLGRNSAGGYTLGRASQLSDPLEMERDCGIQVKATLPPKSEAAAGLAILVSMGKGHPGLFWICAVDDLNVDTFVRCKTPRFSSGIPLTTLQSEAQAEDLGNRKPTGYIYYPVNVTTFDTAYSSDPAFPGLISRIEFTVDPNELSERAISGLSRQDKRPIKFATSNGETSLVLDLYVHYNPKKSKVIMELADRDSLLDDFPYTRFTN
jgi:hypothetical protein